MKIVTRYLFTLSLILTSYFTEAQNLEFYEQPINVKISSAVFNKDREVKIYFPAAYKNTTIDYPVLYVLDGQHKELESFVTSTANYLVRYNTIPAFIISDDTAT